MGRHHQPLVAHITSIAKGTQSRMHLSGRIAGCSAQATSLRAPSAAPKRCLSANAARLPGVGSSDDVTDGASDATALVVVNQNMKQRCKAIGEQCFVCLDKRRAGDNASHQLIACDEG